MTNSQVNSSIEKAKTSEESFHYTLFLEMYGKEIERCRQRASQNVSYQPRFNRTLKAFIAIRLGVGLVEFLMALAFQEEGNVYVHTAHFGGIVVTSYFLWIIADRYDFMRKENANLRKSNMVHELKEFCYRGFVKLLDEIGEKK